MVSRIVHESHQSAGRVRALACSSGSGRHCGLNDDQRVAAASGAEGAMSGRQTSVGASDSVGVRR